MEVIALRGGVQQFCAHHPQTSEIYDITHKAARLLKSQLEGDETWGPFCTKVGQTKFQTQQTELAFLVPPSQDNQKQAFKNALRRVGDVLIASYDKETITVCPFGKAV